MLRHALTEHGHQLHVGHPTTHTQRKSGATRAFFSFSRQFRETQTANLHQRMRLGPLSELFRGITCALPRPPTPKSSPTSPSPTPSAARRASPQLQLDLQPFSVYAYMPMQARPHPLYIIMNFDMVQQMECTAPRRSPQPAAEHRKRQLETSEAVSAFQEVLSLGLQACPDSPAYPSIKGIHSLNLRILRPL